MLFRIITVFSLYFFSASAMAVQVAFVIKRDDLGRLLQLEPGGKYYHVAISYKGHWLHAHPSVGVELTNNLYVYGDIVEVYENSNIPEISAELVSELLKKQFSLLKGWESADSTYCAKLVGQALGIDPQPMSFDSLAYRARSEAPRGELGLSPDDIYQWMEQKGGFYRVINLFHEIDSGCDDLVHY